MKRLLLVIAACLPGLFSSAQCTTTNATSCTCPTTGATDCDLLPDIVVSRDALTNSGGYTEYPQFSAGTSQASQGADDGRLRLNGSTPNIGFGPIEVRGASKWVCGTDTFTTYPGAGGCPGGTDPKQVVMQRIYHKNGTLMQYSDRVAGTMTYHPTHGHQHVNGWGVYTLRLQNPNEPDPTKWPIVGRGSKLAYCLLDLSSCNSSTGYCRDSVNTVLNSTNLPNYGLGGGAYGCSNTLQGISAGYVDTYSKSLDGMWVNIPLGTCNGTYYIVIEIDPNNNFREQNENNNVMAVPITLTRQNASGTGVA
ncbi:MAG: lysyl oxidase family protein, partial [Flavobacteriales bacterium]